jgi:hypothetical protein
MATITFNTADQDERIRKQIKTALAAYHEMLDNFAGNQMRQDAEESEQAKLRRNPGTTSPPKNVQ